MKQKSLSKSPVRPRALSALRDAFVRQRPDIPIDAKGYATDFRDTLLSLVVPDDFEADLTLPVHGPFEPLRFEQKCPTGLRGGRAPNLDVLLTGPDGVAGIESKLTEYLTPHRAAFSPAYGEQIRDGRREQGYFREMLRLIQEPDHYVWLDAAQLIKHAFGLARTFGGRPVTLLYLYWEPANPSADRVFADHRREIADFAARVAGSTPAFRAMTYPDLWSSWLDAGPTGWLARHIAELRARYEVTL